MKEKSVLQLANRLNQIEIEITNLEILVDGKIENINSVFGLTVYSNNEKPTNGEFIALVADKMLLDV